MHRAEELITFASCLGEEIDPERLAALSPRYEVAEEPYAGCIRITVTNIRLCRSVKEQLKITKALTDAWEKQNILLAVFLFVEKGRLAGGQIHKFRIIGYEDGTVNHYELEPTAQEIGIVRRLLNYLKKGE